MSTLLPGNQKVYMMMRLNCVIILMYHTPKVKYFDGSRLAFELDNFVLAKEKVTQLHAINT